MKKIELKRLSEIPCQEIIDLMNNPRVLAQMPLATEEFDEKVCQNFVSKKEELWQTHGYGPWAFVIEGKFAGWGGIQPESGEVDLVLVLHPSFWGYGRSLISIILEKAFVEMKKESVVVFFPPTRKKVDGLLRIGFKKEKEILLHGEQFIVYKLKRDDAIEFLSKNSKRDRHRIKSKAR